MAILEDSNKDIERDTNQVSVFDNDVNKEFISEESAKRFFLTIVDSLLENKEDINNDTKKAIKELLGTPSILSIKSYKCYLRYKAEVAWEKHYNANLDSYQNLSYKIMDCLKLYTYEETISKLNDDICEIASITGKHILYVKDVIKKYKDAYIKNDIVLLSEASSNIKALIKQYNSKAKEQYIKEYVDVNLEQIKGYFQCVTRNICIADNQTEYVLSMLNDNVKIRNIIKNQINDYFGIVLENDQLETFISNVIYNNEKDNYKLLDINYNKKENLQITKSYNRLNRNFLTKINEYFYTKEEQGIFDVLNYYIMDSGSLINVPRTANGIFCGVINSFIKEDDISKLKDYYRIFSKEKIDLLIRLRPIFRESGSYLDIDLDQNKFVIKSNYEILDYADERLYKKISRDYTKIHNKIHEYFYMVATFFNKIEEDNKNKDSILFTDDNYKLVNLSYLTQIDKYKKIIDGIDIDAIKSLCVDDKSLQHLKQLLIEDGLLACFVCGNSDVDQILNVINNYKFVFKDSNDDYSINRLSVILKKAELGKYLDDFTLSLLGEEVAEKIVYNFQFLQGINTPESMKLRLRKAKDLMIKAETRNKSGVPYFDPIIYEDISLTRYNNNDSKILTSGIDTNTCFKICANDNDYLFYSVLNKNGMVVYFEENGKLCGRFTAHTRNNCLLINSIRSLECDYGYNSKEQCIQDDKIITLVQLFGRKMIEFTTNSNCPIDFVVANKSGILESSKYDNNFELIDEKLFTQFVDTYNDDFEEFRHLYDNSEQLLQEVPHYRSGCKQPFTTDFEHYPIVMITSRDNRKLNRLWDISIDTPDCVYERPLKPVLQGKNRKLNSEELERARKINALEYYYNGGNPKDYVIPAYLNYTFDFFEIKDDEYNLIINGTLFHSKIEKQNNKKLVKE